MNTILLGNFKSVEQKDNNMLFIKTDKGNVLQSYNTIIAANIGNKIYLDADNWDYSTTTGKHRNWFLNEDKKATQKKIDSGEYTLCDLN